MRTAVIGIGSNSLRMLLADIQEEKLYRVKRYREGLRTFAALDADGNIEDGMIQKACDKVGEFVREAKSQGAEALHLFATSAVRDARNQETFAASLEAATGLRLEVCSGELEARLSFIGATEHKPSGLIDIGGGSTEIACGEGGKVEQAISLQMGAVRLFRLMPIRDKASAYEVVEASRQKLLPVCKAFLSASLEEWVGVGGTFTTVAALAQQIPWNDRERIHHYPLTVEKVEAVLRQLAPLTLEERLKLPSLQPQRADIVVHGVAILLACMQSLSIPVIHVSECGNLEGYLKWKYIPFFHGQN